MSISPLPSPHVSPCSTPPSRAATITSSETSTSRSPSPLPTPPSRSPLSRSPLLTSTPIAQYAQSISSAFRFSLLDCVDIAHASSRSSLIAANQPAQTAQILTSTVALKALNEGVEARTAQTKRRWALQNECVYQIFTSLPHLSIQTIIHEITRSILTSINSIPLELEEISEEVPDANFAMKHPNSILYGVVMPSSTPSPIPSSSSRCMFLSPISLGGKMRMELEETFSTPLDAIEAHMRQEEEEEDFQGEQDEFVHLETTRIKLDIAASILHDEIGGLVSTLDQIELTKTIRAAFRSPSYSPVDARVIQIVKNYLFAANAAGPVPTPEPSSWNGARKSVVS